MCDEPCSLAASVAAEFKFCLHLLMWLYDLIIYLFDTIIFYYAVTLLFYSCVESALFRTDLSYVICVFVSKQNFLSRDCDFFFFS